MNTIEAVLERSAYSDEEQLVLHVDGKPLDMLLSEASPDDQLDGLVSTLGNWLEDPDEHELVWERLLPEDGQRVRLPVLMCPEHRDLLCTTIVAEVKSLEHTVEWRRVGIDDTPEEDLPLLVGQDVFWLPGVGPFVFARSEYLRMMNVFRVGSTDAGTLH